MARRPGKRARKSATISDPSLSADFELSLVEAFEAAPSLLTIDTVSTDWRRLYQHALSVPSPASGSQSPALSPSSTLPPTGVPHPQDWDPFFLATDSEATAVENEEDGEVGDAAEQSTWKAPRYETSDEPMKQFIPKHQFFLDEMLHREGRGDFVAAKCPACPDPTTAGSASIRCMSCFPGPLLCDACTARRHGCTPYHRIKRWTGVTFENTTLKAIGLKMQLGHQHDSAPCSNPVPLRDDFLILHVNGVHSMTVALCGCDQAARAGTQVQQLLRANLWPATDAEPNTCFSFEMLENYHIMSLQGKISMYDYYHALERMTDNTGTIKIQSRYRAFMRVVAQWHHLKLLKRAGRGHDPMGIAGTKPGELALRCPACPRPRVNLPPDWDKVQDDLKFLYVISVAIDACFWLKRRDVSSKEKDPILGSGWGYFVEDTGYKELLVLYGDQEDISTCTGLSAIDHANTKYSKGYAATGVGAVVCARHEFWLLRAMGDLQKGERYVNMDYIFACAMLDYLVLNKLVSYDIACQWWKGLPRRLAEFPSDLQIPLPKGSIGYVIPKLHYASHKQEGHSPFLLNFRLGCTRLDREGIERHWWWIQPVVSSTRVMGPGSHQGVLEDHLSYSNWCKTVDMPLTLRNRLQKAVKTHLEQAAVFSELTASLIPENVAKWESAVKVWEQDPFNTDDPYVVVSQGMTVAETTRILTHEEQQASATPGFVALHNVSALGFVIMGLDLEEQQECLRVDAKEATPGKATELFERRTALRRKVQKFREVQRIHMPGAAAIIEQDSNCRTDIEHIENARLALPSEISPSHRALVCSARIQDMEARLREAQCRDSLQDVHNKLHTIDHLYKYKKLNVRHQGPNTRARSDISSQDKRKLRTVQKYRRARQAKLALSGCGAWEAELRILNDSDICGLEEDDPNSTAAQKRRKQPGHHSAPAEGRRTISWIWRTSDAEGSDGMVDSLRVEWLKARARVMRWQEEVKLLPEEMRRVLVSHEHAERAWLSCVRARTDVGLALQEGLTAYAHRQATMYHAMRWTFRATCVVSAHSANGGMGEEWVDDEGLSIAVEEEELAFDPTALYELDGEDLDERELYL